MKKLLISLLLCATVVSSVGCASSTNVATSDYVVDDKITYDEQYNCYISNDDTYEYHLYINHSDPANNQFAYMVLANEHPKYDMEGGSSSYDYYVYLDDYDLVVYKVYCSTTGDNGMTWKYERAVSREGHLEILKGITATNPKDLYILTKNLITEEPSIIVSNGMNDEDSRYKDGSYKWQDEYISFSEE